MSMIDINKSLKSIGYQFLKDVDTLPRDELKNKQNKKTIF